MMNCEYITFFFSFIFDHAVLRLRSGPSRLLRFLEIEIKRKAFQERTVFSFSDNKRLLYHEGFLSRKCSPGRLGEAEESRVSLNLLSRLTVIASEPWPLIWTHCTEFMLMRGADLLLFLF